MNVIRRAAMDKQGTGRDGNEVRRLEVAGVARS